mmetsp:Transcript_3955/g.8929  ORF Transcript_3955/g.8929 Transcript_3955/m.8929 type:complete len:223 (+) Transcript_3955:80-748(+)
MEASVIPQRIVPCKRPFSMTLESPVVVPRASGVAVVDGWLWNKSPSTMPVNTLFVTKIGSPHATQHNAFVRAQPRKTFEKKDRVRKEECAMRTRKGETMPKSGAPTPSEHRVFVGYGTTPTTSGTEQQNTTQHNRTPHGNTHTNPHTMLPMKQFTNEASKQAINPMNQPTNQPTTHAHADFDCPREQGQGGCPRPIAFDRCVDGRSQYGPSKAAHQTQQESR